MVRCEELRAAKEQADRWKAARARHVQAQEDRSVHTAGHSHGHLHCAESWFCLCPVGGRPLPLKELSRVREANEQLQADCDANESLAEA